MTDFIEYKSLTIFGTLLATCGLICSTFVTHFGVFYFTYSVVIGTCINRVKFFINIYAVADPEGWLTAHPCPLQNSHRKHSNPFQLSKASGSATGVTSNKNRIFCSICSQALEWAFSTSLPYLYLSCASKKDEPWL